MNHSKGGGLPDYVAQNRSIENTDIVLRHVRVASSGAHRGLPVQPWSGQGSGSYPRASSIEIRISICRRQRTRQVAARIRAPIVVDSAPTSEGRWVGRPVDLKHDVVGEILTPSLQRVPLTKMRSTEFMFPQRPSLTPSVERVPLKPGAGLNRCVSSEDGAQSVTNGRSSSVMGKTHQSDDQNRQSDR